MDGTACSHRPAPGAAINFRCARRAKRYSVLGGDGLCFAFIDRSGHGFLREFSNELGNHLVVVVHLVVVFFPGVALPHLTTGTHGWDRVLYITESSWFEKPGRRRCCVQLQSEAPNLPSWWAEWTETIAHHQGEDK